MADPSFNDLADRLQRRLNGDAESECLLDMLRSHHAELSAHTALLECQLTVAGLTPDGIVDRPTLAVVS